jgi:branched-chain amino acid transport system ATP-binding protein
MPADTTPASAPAEATGSPAGRPTPASVVTRNRAALNDVDWEPGVAKPDPIMVVDKLTRSFGGLNAVSVEHLEVQRGVITGLIGPNGAGKTTLFNLLTGFDKPNTGTWDFYDTWDGENWRRRSLRGLAAHKVSRSGVVRTFQLTKALSKLTVLDNMKLGATGQSGERFLTSLIPALWRSQETAIEARAMDLLNRFKLDTKAGDFAGTLSGGQRKLLEMARALMSQPKVVMLDEPMAGVNPALTQSLLRHVKDLREQGMSVIFVEHDMDVVRDISDWVVVMAQGSIIAEGPPESISQNKLVVDAYLGAHHDQALTFEEEQAQIAAAEEELASEAGIAPELLVEQAQAGVAALGEAPPAADQQPGTDAGPENEEKKA